MKQEIEAIREKVDPQIWGAIDGLRTIGNIGAHMEQDVNLLLDVDPEEAQLLIELNEHLFTEWYINRENRTQLLGTIADRAREKMAAKQGEQQQTPRNGPAADA